MALGSEAQAAMSKSVEKYGSRADFSPASVLLTGATTFLGAFLLDEYVSLGLTVHCLVEAKDDDNALQKLNKSLKRRGKDPFAAESRNVSVHGSAMLEKDLGLSTSTYCSLLRTTSVIVYAQWNPSGTLPFESFDPELKALRNLLSLALLCKQTPRFVFLSSTTAVMNHGMAPIPESMSALSSAAGNTGLAQSRWVAEQILLRHTTIRNRILVLRLGPLSGCSRTGTWTTNDPFVLLLASLKRNGHLPNALPSTTLEWLPVDTAASLIVEATQLIDDDKLALAYLGDMPIYNIVHPSGTLPWTKVPLWLKRFKIPHLYKLVTPTKWLKMLEDLPDTPAHKADKTLLAIWGPAFADGEGKGELKYVTHRTYQALPSLKNVPGLSGEHFEKLWTWIDKHVEV